MTILASETAENHLRLGREALADRLWEVSGHHFQAALEDGTLDPEVKPEISVRLAESLLRSGSADSAIALLDQSHLDGFPETTFWKAQALTRLGRYNEALTLLLSRLENPDLPYRLESIISGANLHLILGHPQEALDLLASTPADESDPASLKLLIRRIEILLDFGRAAEARGMFPEISSLPPNLTMQTRLLEGRLLLAEGLPHDAAVRFQSIVNSGLESRTRIHHLAAIGYCDSLLAQGKSSEASAFLLELIQSEPGSPVLDQLFERLIPLIPSPSTSNDPVWDQLADWSPVPAVPATGIIASWNAGAEGALPVETTPRPNQNLIAHSLHAQAMGWSKSSLPQAASQTRHFIRRMLTECPSHPLTGRIMLEIARVSLASGDTASAFDQLDSLLHSAATPDIRGESGFLQAFAYWQQGDAENASAAFRKAAENLDSTRARAAAFNAHLIQWIQHIEEDTPAPPPPFDADSGLTTDLELERALASKKPENRLQLLETFLATHTQHPRSGEARLAAADAALSVFPPDLSFANAQIETINAMPDDAKPAPDRIALVNIRIHDRKGDSEAVIRLATAFINERTETPEATEVMFLLGRNLYQSGKYNDARLALERLASIDGDTPQAQACWLLSARAAAMVATQQSKQEATTLFDKAITITGPLSAVARLEKARLLVDMSRPVEAEALLADWFSALEETDPVYLPAGFLLAESIRSQNTPKALENAMAIYDKLVAGASNEPAALHRLQYLRGLTFEQMGSPDSTSGKRVREAFVAYYSVLEPDTPPAEWYYFELCGFKALGMLIDSGRWPAAIACARRIASFQGPRAKEAADIASQLQLKHQVWED